MFCTSCCFIAWCNHNVISYKHNNKFITILLLFIYLHQSSIAIDSSLLDISRSLEGVFGILYHAALTGWCENVSSLPSLRSDTVLRNMLLLLRPPQEKWGRWHYLFLIHLQTEILENVFLNTVVIFVSHRHHPPYFSSRYIITNVL